MVKIADISRDIASGQWLDALTMRLSASERDLVLRADAWASQHRYAGERAAGPPRLDHARAAAGILGSLRVDGEAIAAMLLLDAPLATRAQRDALAAEFGTAVASLVEGVTSMAQIQALRSRNAAGARPGDRAAQLESLRKMFLAMAQDVRVVLIKLADQVQRLRELA
ncbi:MAG TPA: HD domain-containing protein, partial [Burkholderiales bacterium]